MIIYYSEVVDAGTPTRSEHRTLITITYNSKLVDIDYDNLFLFFYYLSCEKQFHAPWQFFMLIIINSDSPSDSKLANFQPLSYAKAKKEFKWTVQAARVGNCLFLLKLFIFAIQIAKITSHYSYFFSVKLNSKLFVFSNLIAVHKLDRC